MTLEEAIKHEEEIVKEEQYEYQECVATHDMEGAKNCRKYAEEHRQLAEWLKELQEWRSGKRVRMANKNTETLIFDIGE